MGRLLVLFLGMALTLLLSPDTACASPKISPCGHPPAAASQPVDSHFTATGEAPMPWELFHPALLQIEPQKSYYVSPKGDDGFDGLTRKTAFATLKHALTVVRPGDEIRVLPGTYSESLMLVNVGEPGARITIRGIGKTPVFSGRRSDSMGFWCEHCENLTLENLSFCNYTDVGAGVYRSKHITMRNLKVHHNGFAPRLKGWEIEGYGIHIDCSRDISIQNSRVYRNGPDPRPHGVLGTGINTFECTDCLIRGNRSYHNIGGGILVEDGVNVRVEKNRVKYNYLDATEDERWAGGIWVDGGHDVLVKGNIVQKNMGPGVQISDEDHQKPYGYVLQNNVITHNKHGIYIWNFKIRGFPPDRVLRRLKNKIRRNTVRNVWIVP